MTSDVPLPPIELRRAVGPTDPSWFENQTGRGALDDVEMPGKPALDYTRVLDFGCGCGRLARQMMLQRHPPDEYCGLDLNKAAIEWCAENLSPHRSRFTFRHLDIRNPQFNPNAAHERVPLLVPMDHYTLVIAHSVFTHIIERDVEFYFEECAAALALDGLFWSTWFVFDKRYFPVLQSFQNSLYINLQDPSNAVWYDVGFINDLHRKNDLRIFSIAVPDVRGFQYCVLARKGDTRPAVQFPEDLAPVGIARPPINSSLDGELSDALRKKTNLGI